MIARMRQHGLRDVLLSVGHLRASVQVAEQLSPLNPLSLGPRLVRQPDQHLAQLRAAGDPLREIQPQRDCAGLHVHAVGIAAGAAPVGAVGAEQRVA